MKSKVITTEMVVAVHQCKRKAYFLLHRDDQGSVHEYDRVIARRADSNRQGHLDRLGTNVACANGAIMHGDINASCDLLCQQKRKATKRHAPFEPVLAVGTNSITSDQRIAIAFAGYAVGQTHRYQPTHGFIIPFQGKPKSVYLSPLRSRVEESLDWLQSQRSKSENTPPRLILNEHCVRCPFREHCGPEAEKQDNLSLLERMTPKQVQKYASRGIFTVNQLSFVFRPRRRRKGATPPPPTFNVELQALALRVGKTYVERLPVIPDHPVEVYLDIEGIPDQAYDYLIGVQVKSGDKLTTHSFWADSRDNELGMFRRFVDTVAPLDGAPIFHYGSYESKSLRRVFSRYGLEVRGIEQRLVNVNEFVFGRIYFPSRSNSLKSLGAIVGATWEAPIKSGLESLVWRHRWEDDVCDREELKEQLIQYNISDCDAVRRLTAELRSIGDGGESRADVDFADSPKQHTTNRGSEVHRVFERILQSAHANYRQGRIRIGQSRRSSGSTGAKVGAPKGHPGYVRVVPKTPGRIVKVRRRLNCPNGAHKGEPLVPTGELSEHTIIDLAFTKSGCRKSVTKYIGAKSRCPKCRRDYVPPIISRFGSGQCFGDGFQAWAVYQRVALRLPYRAITQTIEDLFSESVTEAAIVSFVHRLSTYYAPTERALLKRILDSPHVHVDETKISIRGSNNYVWVLTNGTLRWPVVDGRVIP